MITNNLFDLAEADSDSESESESSGEEKIGGSSWVETRGVYEKKKEEVLGDGGVVMVPYYQYEVHPPEGWTRKPQTLEGGVFLNRFWLPPEWLVDQYSPGRVVIYNGVFIPHNDQVREDFLDHIDRIFPNSRNVLQGYYETIQTTMGFDVPDLPDDAPFSVIRPADFLDFVGISDEDLEFFRRIRHRQIKQCLDAAVDQLCKLTDDPYQLVDRDNQPEKANLYSAGSDLFFLTFKAKNLSSKQVSSFQAIVESFPADIHDVERKEFLSTLSYIRRLTD